MSTMISKIVLGFVYTPFIRVALAAQASFDSGRHLRREDVAQWLEPVVYIAFRWYCCVDRDHGDSLETWNPFTPPFDNRIEVNIEQRWARLRTCVCSGRNLGAPHASSGKCESDLTRLRK
jgi:hypothetical protein